MKSNLSVMFLHIIAWCNQELWFTCDGMHGESNVLSLLPQDVDHLCDGILTAALSQAEAGHDDDVLGLGKSLDE